MLGAEVGTQFLHSTGQHQRNLCPPRRPMLSQALPMWRQVVNIFAAWAEKHDRTDTGIVDVIRARAAKNYNMAMPGEITSILERLRCFAAGIGQKDGRAGHPSSCNLPAAVLIS